MLFTLKATQQKRGGCKALMLGIALVTALLCIPAQGYAMDFDVGKGVLVDLDTHLSWTGSWRMKDQDKYLIANANADDGDRNFEKNDWVNNLWNVTVDLDVKYDKFGVFVRPRAYYDFAYDGHNANDSPLTNNNGPAYGGPLTATNKFMDETLDLHRDKVEILDAYAYGIFYLGEHSVDVRLGRQVVNWGQSLYTLAGIGGSQNPLDATRSNVPGTALREVYLPQGMAYANVGIWNNFSIGAYYGFEYEPSRIDEAGAYFSTSDGVLEAGRNFLADPAIAGYFGTGPTVDRRLYKEAKDNGQFGIALQYVASWFRDATFDLYYINYHEKFPMLHVNNGFGGTRRVANWNAYAAYLPPGVPGFFNYFDGSSYEILFNEDVRAFALAMNTMVAGASLGVELNYRQDISVAVKDALSPLRFNNYNEADAFSAMTSVYYYAGSAFLWNQLTLAGELGMIRIYDLGDTVLNGKD
jgi:hypothetical protein